MEEMEGVVGEAPVAEKMLTQGQVNEIVKREKARAAEKARAESDAMYQQQFAQANTSQVPPQEGGGQIDIENVKNQVYNQFLDELAKHRDDAEREQQENHLKSIADKYYLKMGKGSEMFNDFNEVLGDFEPSQFPNAVMLAAEADNTPEIMYELAKNPEKLLRIDSLAQRSPKLAMKEMQRLSESINTNLQAKQNHQSAPPPLSKPKPSSVGADNGKMSLKDYKSAPWLRG